MNPVKCYECVSRSNYFDNYCGDPFKANHPKMNTSVCTGQCVKWVRLERVGKLFYSNIHQIGYCLQQLLIECIENNNRRGNLEWTIQRQNTEN